METSDQGPRPHGQAVRSPLGTDDTSSVNETSTSHANRTADDSGTKTSTEGLMSAAADVVPASSSTATLPADVSPPPPPPSDFRPGHAVGDGPSAIEPAPQVTAPVVSVIADTPRQASENAGTSDESASVPSGPVDRGVESALQSENQTSAPSGPSTLEEWVAAAPTVEVTQQPQPASEASGSVSNVSTIQQIPDTLGSSAYNFINNGPNVPRRNLGPADGSESRPTSSAPSETPKLPPVPQLPPVHPVTMNDSPPYHPPTGVQYPKDPIANRFYHSMSPKPKLSGVAPQSLYRPQYLPPDLDSRIDPHCIWMGVDKHTCEHYTP
jgi:hypothetical protein